MHKLQVRDAADIDPLASLSDSGAASNPNEILLLLGSVETDKELARIRTFEMMMLDSAKN